MSYDEDCFYDPSLDDMGFVYHSLLLQEEMNGLAFDFFDVSCRSTNHESFDSVKEEKEFVKEPEYVPSGYELDSYEIASKASEEIEMRTWDSSYPYLRETIDAIPLGVEVQMREVIPAWILETVGSVLPSRRGLFRRLGTMLSPKRDEQLSHVVEYDPKSQEFQVRRRESIEAKSRSLFRRFTGTQGDYRRGKTKGLRRYVGYPNVRRKTYEGFKLLDPPESF